MSDSQTVKQETKSTSVRKKGKSNGAQEKKRERKHNGTLIICVQNLAVSGANAVLLNIIKGGFHPGNTIVLSPEKGELSKFFQESGVAVRYGSLGPLLEVVTDIRLVICNTIMTAHYVLLLKEKRIPHCWIIHEWWPKDILHSMLSARKLTYVNEEMVHRALQIAHHIIYVCAGQQKLYGSTAPFSVIPIGVPAPEPHFYVERTKQKMLGSSRPMTFLCLGIVCPRKNQVTAVKYFKEMARESKDVRLLVVGARYERDYEIEYVKQVEQAIDKDPRIQLFPCTFDVEPYYAQADVLLMTSTNEVTPLTISESMIRGIPVITTDVAGIPDMLSDGLEGFLIPIEKKEIWVRRMRELTNDRKLMRSMALAAAERARKQYAMTVMISSYRQLTFILTPPVILVDMDGVLVDWDSGFFKAWGSDRPGSAEDRTDYEIEKYVGPEFAEEAKTLYSSQGFFYNLPPMRGAIDAINAIAARGYIVKICTKPILSPYCIQEKTEWVRKHLGMEWMSRMIITYDKTLVVGALLIDDHPDIAGARFPSWRQVIFDAPYNRHRTDLPRLTAWERWEQVFDEELLFAPKPGASKKMELSKLRVGKRAFNVIRNLSWPMLPGESSPPTENGKKENGEENGVDSSGSGEERSTKPGGLGGGVRGGGLRGGRCGGMETSISLENLLVDPETDP